MIRVEHAAAEGFKLGRVEWDTGFVQACRETCGVSREGIDYESADGELATLFVLLVAPESGGALHVKVLANISRLLKEESVRRTLRESASPDAFFAALKSAESVHIPQ